MSHKDSIDAARVREFHAVMGLPHRQPNEVPIQTLTEEANFRNGLQFEEMRETLEGLEADDFLEIADGLGDMLFVAHGSQVQLGHTNTNEDWYTALKLGLHLVRTLMDKPVVNEEATPFNSHEGYATQQRLLIIIIKGAAEVLDIPLAEVYDAICRSNISKVNHPHTEGCALDNKTKTRCDCGAVIYRESDGKILKPDTYTPATPLIRAILEEQVRSKEITA